MTLLLEVGCCLSLAPPLTSNVTTPFKAVPTFRLSMGRRQSLTSKFHIHLARWWQRDHTVFCPFLLSIICAHTLRINIGLYHLSQHTESVGPLKTRLQPTRGKKGKVLKKQADPPPLPTSVSGGKEEEASVRDLLINMTDMMASLNTRLEAIEGDSQKTRKVTFCGEAPGTYTAGQHLQPPPGLPASIARPAAPEVLTTENVLPPLQTTSWPDYDQPSTPLGTVHNRREPQMADSLLAWLTAGPTKDDTWGNELQHLPYVSEAVRSRVTQHMWGAPPASFLTDDEDSA